MKKNLEGKLQEIIRFARKKNNTISYNMAVDILKDKEQINDKDITLSLEELFNRGIIVTPEEDEEYLANETDPDTFIPADVQISQRTINVYI